MSKKRDRVSSDELAREACHHGQRTEQLIGEELNFIFDSEVRDPDLESVRVTRVELSPDGSCARVWFVTAEIDDAFPASEIEAALARASRFLRSRLCDALSSKRTPELRFYLDVPPSLED